MAGLIYRGSDICTAQITDSINQKLSLIVGGKITTIDQ